MTQRGCRPTLGNAFIGIAVVLLLGIGGAWGWEQWQGKLLQDRLRTEPATASVVSTASMTSTSEPAATTQPAKTAAAPVTPSRVAGTNPGCDGHADAGLPACDQTGPAGNLRLEDRRAGFGYDMARRQHA